MYIQGQSSNGKLQIHLGCIILIFITFLPNFWVILDSGLPPEVHVLDVLEVKKCMQNI